jgi:hypothetical protein
MNRRERLSILDEGIAAYERDANSLLNDAFKLHAPRQEELAAIIQEEQLLAGDWHVERGRVAILQLRADVPVLPQLYELLKPDAHMSYHLWDDHTNLSFDDGEVRLSLPTASAAQFIRDNGLKVRRGELDRDREKLIEQLRRLNEVSDLLEG